MLNIHFLLGHSLGELDILQRLASISPYSVRMRKTTDQKKLRIWTLFERSVTNETFYKQLWRR